MNHAIAVVMKTTANVTVVVNAIVMNHVTVVVKIVTAINRVICQIVLVKLKTNAK